MLTALPPLPPAPTGPDGSLLTGLYAGELTTDPVAAGPRAGRVRRWCYAAAGDADTVVGAAVVHLGFVAVVFAFAVVGGRTVAVDLRRPLGAGVEVGRIPGHGAAAHTRTGTVAIDGAGGLQLQLPTEAGTLRAEVEVVRSVTPAVCLTGTQGGGWNATRKLAGSTVRGSVQIGDADAVELDADAGGWADWTAGRQDRTTVWRWAAGAGVAEDGRRVGLNASTGMNAAAGEDVVWWDGVPHRVEVADLSPVGDDRAGDWQVIGPALGLRLRSRGVRAAAERLPLLTSDYVQPIGTWEGRVADPSGATSQVTLAGVAEDHLAVW